MNKLPVTCSLGSMGLLLGQLLSLMKSEQSLPDDVSKDEIWGLIQDLDEISTTVMDIAKEEDPSSTDLCWLKEVREISYDAEDCIHVILRSRGDDIPEEISELRARYLRAIKRRERYQQISCLRNHLQQDAIERQQRRKLALEGFKNLVKSMPLQNPHKVLDEPMNKLISLLAFDSEPQLKIVAVFEPAGVWKTILARRLYHFYGSRYHRRAFLPVSRNPDTRRILANLLSQIKGPRPHGSFADVQSLADEIKKYLQDKTWSRGDMNKLPVTCSLGSMGLLLGQLLSLMKSEQSLPDDVSKDEIWGLIQDLDEISTTVMDIAKEEDPSSTDLCWLKEVREISYDAEDCIHVILRSRGDDIPEEISELRARYLRAIKRRERYQQISCLRNHLQQDAIERQQRRKLALEGFKNLVKSMPLQNPHKVLDEPMNKLISLLAFDSEPQLKIVAVFEPAGVWKTILARRLYHFYGSRYHRRAFLPVSRNPDTRRILANLLSQIKGPRPHGSFADVQSLADEIKKYLQDKTYLIIVDDLWTTEVWNILRCIFPDGGGQYSRIITTTIIEEVALACCSDDRNNMYELGPLRDDQSGQSFFRTSEEIKEVINLNYSILPAELKTCLLYLNMYPEDYVISKDDLVKQWVAETFVIANGRNIQKVAADYFDELVNRGMIQPVDIGYNDEVLSCTVHHMVLDLIAWKSMEDNFITVLNYVETIVGHPDKVRRLCLKFGGAKAALIPESLRMSQVRSLLFSGFYKSMPSIVAYRLLRVLILYVWAENEESSIDLTRICDMFLLKYLKIAGNITVKLPEQMKELHFLETLEVHARVHAVPMDIFHLQSLLHVLLPGSLVLPSGIGRMKSLLTLAHFDLNSNSEANIDSLGELTSLQDLHLTCSTVPNENNLERNIKFLGSVMGKLRNLRSVSLLPAGSSHTYTSDVTGSDPSLGVSFDGMSNVSPVPTFLQRIVLSRHYCVFSSLPRWIKETDCLQVLNITIKELLRDDINVLKRLLALTALSLYIHGAPLERIVFGNEGFSVLKYLKLVNTTAVPCLTFETGAMPNLRKLKLGFNAQRVDRHGSAPISIEHLTGAKEISAKIGCAGADEAETVLSAAVTNHPRNPRINIQLVDWKFYTGGGTNLSTKAEEHHALEQEHVSTDSNEYDVDASEVDSKEDENNQAVIMDSRAWEHSSVAKGKKKEVMVLEQEPDGIHKTTIAQDHGPRIRTIHWDEGWAFIQQGINKIKDILEGRMESQFTPSEYINNYTMVYNLCWQKSPERYEEKLYNKYRESFEDYLTSEVLPSLREKHGEFVLKELVQRWSNHNVMAKWMTRFFMELDRHFVSQRSLSPLKEVALTCFRKSVYQDIKGKVKDTVLELMQHEREGGHIDRALLSNVLSIFVEIGSIPMECYEDDFENHLLKNTEDYYFAKAQTWIHEHTCSDYLIEVEEYLKREQDRNYLPGNTKEKLLKKAQSVLLGRYRDEILENKHDGFLALLRDNKVGELSRMYRLFSNVSCCLEHISEMFKEYITNEGTALVKQAEDSCTDKKPKKQDLGGMQEQDFVWKIVQLHQKYVAHVTECFQRHDLFRKALRYAFVVFCNMGVSGISITEILSTFFDNLLTKDCSEEIGDEVFEDALRKVVTLLEHIYDKDLFATLYRKKLARRLLSKKFANDERERIMLRLLKEQFGGQFTSKMEGMVTDIIVANDQQTWFKDYVDKHPELNPGINMAVTVLTRAFWPTYKNFDMRLPTDMAKCVEVFQKCYQGNTKNRKLTWIYSLGTCNMDAMFGGKSIELIVTPCQAALLFLFNGCDRLGYSEIVKMLNLPSDDFAKHLLSSVSCAKYKILNKYPNNTTISTSDVFEFNSEFTDKKRRIKISHDFEKKKVMEDLNLNRRYAIEASIVRIMKSRRVIGHSQLVTECVQQLSLLFKPEVSDIKKRIDDLIQREYMKRDDKSPKTYIYVAEGSWIEPEDTRMSRAK